MILQEFLVVFQHWSPRDWSLVLEGSILVTSDLQGLILVVRRIDPCCLISRKCANNSFQLVKITSKSIMSTRNDLLFLQKLPTRLPTTLDQTPTKNTHKITNFNSTRLLSYSTLSSLHFSFKTPFFSKFFFLSFSSSFWLSFSLSFSSFSFHKSLKF